MQLYIDFKEMARVFATAGAQGRNQLFEHETYALLSALGSESVPEYVLLNRTQRLTADALAPFLGDKVVLKVASPDVVHKSDVGGVKVVPKMAGKVRSNARRMVDTVTDQYAAHLESHPDQMPDHFKGLEGEDLKRAVNKRIQGVLITQFMPPDSDALGNELLVSLRWTREFGMVITAGLGGRDTELYAARFRPGAAVVSASTAHVSAREFFTLFKQTIAYEKCAGLTRGNERLVSDEQLLECFGAFIAVGNHFSPLNPEAAYVIEELEVNPFAFVDYEMVPLDGLCRFSRPFTPESARGIERISHLLHPESFAVIGVSATKQNFGRHILNNVLKAGFDPGRMTIISPSAQTIDGVACVPSLEKMETVDLLVVAVGAAQVPDLLNEIIDRKKARSVILIPGGMGETEASRERAEQVIEKIKQGHGQDGDGPVFLGGNCLGMISRPGKMDTFFVPEAISPKRREMPPVNLALVSQSGAFALVRMTDMVAGDPAYNITVGNQMDLTIGDFITYLADDDQVGIIAVYVEGFKDLDGLHACRGIRRAVENGKEVIVYKSGRTPEGKTALSGHTASVAGDYMVCTSCLGQAGALVTESHDEFDGLVNLARYLHGKEIHGSRIAGVSPAGFETVGIADSLEASDSGLELAEFSADTQDRISALFDQGGLSEIMDVRNPLDLTPGAPDPVYTGSLEALMADPGVDAVVTSVGSLAPATSAVPDPHAELGFSAGEESPVNTLPALAETAVKPLVVFNDAGMPHHPINQALREAGIPVFPSCSRAMGLLARYTAYRLRLEQLRGAAAPADTLE